MKGLILLGVAGFGVYYFYTHGKATSGTSPGKPGQKASAPSTKYPWSVPQASRQDNAPGNNQPYAQKPPKQSTADQLKGVAAAGLAIGVGKLWDNLFNSSDDSGDSTDDLAQMDVSSLGVGQDGSGLDELDSSQYDDYFGGDTAVA